MKWTKSRELWERSRRSLAGGISSLARADDNPFPLFFDRGEGSKLFDVDGNEYIDYLLGFGPLIFGHSPDFILEAVADASGKVQMLGAQHELEIEVSELVQSMVPCAERVRFAGSGTEAVQLALRAARAFTGRPKIIMFEGMYHGWMDSVAFAAAPEVSQVGFEGSLPPAAQSDGLAPGAQHDVIMLPWNDADVLHDIVRKQGDEIAAIITEPIMCNCQCVFPRAGYIQEMRRLCDEQGIVLIFDEVITGFRVASGGAQEVLGVIPDLATFAKALAAGYPIGMVAGREELMAPIGDGTVRHGGTGNSNVISMAAAKAALTRVAENEGAVLRDMQSIGRSLMDGLESLGRRHEQRLLVQGPGPMFGLAFTQADEIMDYRDQVRLADHDKYRRFRRGMLENGIRFRSDGGWFLSSAHSAGDVAATLDAADRVLAEL